ncbi:MAG: 30S ribosomal protein S4 [Candidatus Nitrosocaldus sp.]|nr:30S ribosomal protein S4 [Candidatus Nitrosocaldus sp.]MDW8000003.1 30S ribosomal protein S4 [Candidatus Nitrosocaldus sp.]
MGDVKNPRKTYHRPKRHWDSSLLMQELEIVGNYGLRNKRELWKAQSELSRIRKRARDLLALPVEVRSRREAELLRSLNRLGLVKESATLDDILNLKVQDILERRLQTLVLRKGLARTALQARQMIVHGHVMIGDRRVDRPGYWVKRGEEDMISLA